MAVIMGFLEVNLTPPFAAYTTPKDCSSQLINTAYEKIRRKCSYISQDRETSSNWLKLVKRVFTSARQSFVCHTMKLSLVASQLKPQH